MEEFDDFMRWNIDRSVKSALTATRIEVDSETARKLALTTYQTARDAFLERIEARHHSFALTEAYSSSLKGVQKTLRPHTFPHSHPRVSTQLSSVDSYHTLEKGFSFRDQGLSLLPSYLDIQEEASSSHSLVGDFPYATQYYDYRTSEKPEYDGWNDDSIQYQFPELSAYNSNHEIRLPTLDISLIPPSLYNKRTQDSRHRSHPQATGPEYVPTHNQVIPRSPNSAIFGEPIMVNSPLSLDLP